MALPQRITINEVGPRDGLQSQSTHVDLDGRLALVKQLAAAGLQHIEVGSFVSPKAVPQMAGTGDLVRELLNSDLSATPSVLIPNRKGYELAREAGAKNLALVVAATDTMNQKNINMATEQIMTASEELIAAAVDDHLTMQVYLAVAVECPFEGLVAPQQVIALAERLMQYGAKEVVLADTIGAANPLQMTTLLQPLIDSYGAASFSCHFHDTRGMAVANAYAAAQLGISKFDSSIGGLGGCPFAPGASGNVATEDLAVMFEQMGCDTGINLPGLLDAIDLAHELTSNCYGGKASRWLRKAYQSA